MNSKLKKLVPSTASIAKLAILTALSFVLYAFCKFPLTFMFPSFLDMQFSELPALLAGFSMGPVAGCFVIVAKCLLKLPLSPTSTGFVGELTDIIIGICFVLPASLIYAKAKSKRSALVGTAVGALAATLAAILVNRFISIPFYVQFFYSGNWNILLGMVRPLYANVTQENFYAYYILLAVIPFNLLRSVIVALVTFLVYKRLSPILHWEVKSKTAPKKVVAPAGESAILGVNESGETADSKEDETDCETADDETKPYCGVYHTSSAAETEILGEKLAESLKEGDVLLLNGELGTGKTTFTKGIARGLGSTEEVTSPTFTFLNVYEGGRLTVNHIDMYRAESADEVFELGLSDCLGRGVCVIEWNKLPTGGLHVIHVDLEYEGEGRTVRVW